jgi:hypothetical protein
MYSAFNNCFVITSKKVFYKRKRFFNISEINDISVFSKDISSSSYDIYIYTLKINNKRISRFSCYKQNIINLKYEIISILSHANDNICGNHSYDSGQSGVEINFAQPVKNIIKKLLGFILVIGLSCLAYFYYVLFVVSGELIEVNVVLSFVGVLLSMLSPLYVFHLIMLNRCFSTKMCLTDESIIYKNKVRNINIPLELICNIRCKQNSLLGRKYYNLTFEIRSFNHSYITSKKFLDIFNGDYEEKEVDNFIVKYIEDGLFVKEKIESILKSKGVVYGDAYRQERANKIAGQHQKGKKLNVGWEQKDNE